MGERKKNTGQDYRIKPEVNKRSLWCTVVQSEQIELMTEGPSPAPVYSPSVCDGVWHDDCVGASRQRVCGGILGGDWEIKQAQALLGQQASLLSPADYGQSQHDSAWAGPVSWGHWEGCGNGDSVQRQAKREWCWLHWCRHDNPIPESGKDSRW